MGTASVCAETQRCAVKASQSSRSSRLIDQPVPQFCSPVEGGDCLLESLWAVRILTGWSVVADVKSWEGLLPLRLDTGIRSDEERMMGARWIVPRMEELTSHESEKALL
jgi:hypothetical protein